ncbi:hypothetical protein IWQ60_004043 [Tieghemiomyces parasiticus]|uniref:protein-histidine N-methyltransferase n=1 Tax=Tieghemiomyces parasiticus TaxID=78921 RepID=A0A9W8A8I0_9FUNG|nr:hypothetical protein IWQ60_004043 [Tieghemiomyces parasiticus]
MAFQFNFTPDILDVSDDESQTGMSVEHNHADTPVKGTAANIPERPCQEFTLDLHRLPPALHLDPIVFHDNDHARAIYRRQLNDVKFQLAQEDTMLGEDQTDLHGPITPATAPVRYAQFLQQVESTDLISGEYEGGMKTWECSIDLLRYLAQHRNTLPLEGKRIIEETERAEVHLQDYNFEVIELITQPNVLANLLWSLPRPEGDSPVSVSLETHPEPTDAIGEAEKAPMVNDDKGKVPADAHDDGDESDDGGEMEVEEEDSDDDEPRLPTIHVTDRDQPALLARFTALTRRCRLFAGDWSKLAPYLAGSAPIEASGQQYDLILTSETIYSQASQLKLYAAIRALLRPGGVALIAAKSVYFGCDGNVHTFSRLVEERGEFRLTTVATYGSHLRREVIRMEFL